MQIKILATSDMHGYIMPTSYSEKKDGFAFWNRKSSNHAEKVTCVCQRTSFFKLKMGILFKVRRLVTT
ncbi:hypothetical protein EfsSVR2332_10170 [Enterococcus faecalis]|uniref:Uncharacterized protein n=1 Tax=Enterococcus faecalis TaxID=1351 RepID=A0AC59HMS9_ENTFL|nr:hypothetical protein EfsSVR2332_10170 [Enterococcus faecalis]